MGAARWMWMVVFVAACGGGNEARAPAPAPAPAPAQPAAPAPGAAAVPSGIGGSGPATETGAGQAQPTGTVRYVSGTGNDANPGTLAQPWRSLARVQAAADAGSLLAGDAVLFERGHRYAGSLSLGSTVAGSSSAPVTFGSYGSTRLPPVLDGMQAVQGWQPLGGGRWRASCPGSATTPALLRLDGVNQRLARWPNEDEADRGYRYFTATNGSTSLTDAALPAGRNWVGGEVVVRSIAWVLDRLPITAQTAAGQLSLGASPSYPLQVGYGYFIQNHPDAIDLEGEWAFNASDRGITLQSATDPNSRRVEVPAVANVLRVRGARFVQIEDLVLEGSSGHAVDLAGCSAITLQRLRVGFAGNTGIKVDGCPDTVITETIVREAMNNGLDSWRCAGCRVERTTVEYVGRFAGMGANGDGAYQGVSFGGDTGRPATLSRLWVHDIGYIGINLTFAATLSGSLVQAFNQVKVDGAGIYTWRTADITIADNTVLDAGGTTAGTPWGSTATHGIYLDDNSERMTVTRNTVGNVGASGIFLHNTRDLTVTDNLIYNAAEAGVLMGDDALGSYGLERTVFRGNTIVASGVPMLDISSNQSSSLFASLGTIDANRYCDPFAAATVRVALPGRPASALSLAQWRAQFGRDGASTACPDRFPAFTLQSTPGATRVVNGSFDSNLAPWFGWPGDTLDARWETGRLDGGSLRLGFAGPSPQVHFDAPVGAVSAGDTYLLDLSAIGISGDPSLDVYLRQAGAPYERLSQTVPLLLGSARSEEVALLRVQRSHGDSLLVFESRSTGATAGLDNVKLRPVTATLRGLRDVARLYVNPEPKPTNFVLDVASKTLDGQTLPAGQLMLLDPYRAVVLLRP